jgi:hypothetical protein
MVMAARVALQVLCDDYAVKGVIQELGYFIEGINDRAPVAIMILGEIEGLSEEDKKRDGESLNNYIRNDWAEGSYDLASEVPRWEG